MRLELNATHNPSLRSWVTGANASGTDFPIQNLPFAVFRRAGGREELRSGVAIGEQILDLRAVYERNIFPAAVKTTLAACCEPTLNRYMALGPEASSNLRHAYWTIAQMVAHHTVNGCNLRPGDLLGSGTMSGPAPGEAGSLLELTDGGKQSLALDSGETRTFLEDGDRVLRRAFCERDNHTRIGFGTASGMVLPSRPAGSVL